MKVIQANCRVQFTPQDIAFLLATIDQHQKSAEAIHSLLGDEHARNLLLDSEALFTAVMEKPHNLPISLHFFFYILVRRVLKDAEITNETLADYVAELLTEFTRSQDLGQASSEDAIDDGLDTWMKAAASNDKRKRFERKAYCANRILFLTGIQEAWLRRRTVRRGAPSLEFYESVGLNLYRDAGRHRLAERYQLTEIFAQLAEQFHETRLALNDLADRLLNLDDPGFPILATTPSGATENPFEA